MLYITVHSDSEPRVEIDLLNNTGIELNLNC